VQDILGESGVISTTRENKHKLVVVFLTKINALLIQLCIDQNIAKKVIDIIKKTHEDEEIQSIVLTASRLQNDLEYNNPELSECVLNIKSSFLNNNNLVTYCIYVITT
jgi:hypothetical protein